MHRLLACAAFCLTSAGMIAASQAADRATGFYRYEKNRLTIAHGCAVSLPSQPASQTPRTLVVLSDKPVDCAAAAKSPDPEATINDTLRDAMQGQVRFTVGPDGKVEKGAVIFSTWKPMDSFIAQDTYDATIAAAQKGRIAGTLKTDGVQILKMATDRELEVNVSFNLPVLPAASTK